MVYCWAVSAVAAIGVGALAVSFLALRDLMRVIGYSSATAWIFPAIIDTAVAVSTLMLVALGDKPARRARTATASISADQPIVSGLRHRRAHGANANVRRSAPSSRSVSASAWLQPLPAQAVQTSAQTEGVLGDADIAEVDADLASVLIASGVTT